MVVIVVAIVVNVVVVTVMDIVVVVDDSASLRQGWRPEGGSLQERGNMPEEKCPVSNAILRCVLRPWGSASLCMRAILDRHPFSRGSSPRGGRQDSGGSSHREENIAVVIIVAAIVVIVLVVTVIAGVVIIDISTSLPQGWNPVLGEGTRRQAESKNPVLHAICKGSSHTNFRHRGRTARTL